MTPEQHDERATVLIERGVEAIDVHHGRAELYFRAADIHARLAMAGNSRTAGLGPKENR